MSILTDFLRRKYGAETSTNENPVIPAGIIGAIPVMVLRRNPNRIGWTVINMSVNIMYLAFHGDVSTTRGIILDAGGGVVSSWIEQDGEMTQMEVWLVAGGAGSPIYALETEVY